MLRPRGTDVFEDSALGSRVLSNAAGKSDGVISPAGGYINRPDQMTVTSLRSLVMDVTHPCHSNLGRGSVGTRWDDTGESWLVVEQQIL